MIIAEISANHLGQLSRAKKLIEAAKEAGAGFVKFQHYTPETITVKGRHPDLKIGGGSLWDGRTTWDLYEEAMMPWEWTAELVSHCAEVGINWLSTPFDESAVDFLEEFAPPMYKIASFEIIDLPLIRYAAGTGRPLIISTGMSTISEIDAAVEAAASSGAPSITLLRTNSGYPAPLNEMDLSAIPEMKKRWGNPVGLSDHTLGSVAALVSVGLGATVFEKHFTLNRLDGGPDAAFSAEPQELKEYVELLAAAQLSLGLARFGPSAAEEASIALRPSLRAIQDIREGEFFTSDNVKSVRPGGGLQPDRMAELLSKKSNRAIFQGDPILETDLVTRT